MHILAATLSGFAPGNRNGASASPSTTKISTTLSTLLPGGSPESAPIADTAQVFNDPHLNRRDFFWDSAHPSMGEVLQAFVVPREDATPTSIALLRFARERIAGYKLPYAIEIRPDLPVLASGKPVVSVPIPDRGDHAGGDHAAAPGQDVGAGPAPAPSR